MKRPFEALTRPDWEFLIDFALTQGGLFTAKQATVADHSPQLLQHYMNVGKIVRVRRGIYRVVHYPQSNHEHLVALWLWSDEMGVVSHETALALHRLRDPALGDVHLTAPPGWRRRHLRVPKGVVLHYADVPRGDLTLRAPVPSTRGCPEFWAKREVRGESEKGRWRASTAGRAELIRGAQTKSAALCSRRIALRSRPKLGTPPNPQRTLSDCVRAGLALPVIVQALQRAIAQGHHPAFGSP